MQNPPESASQIRRKRRAGWAILGYLVPRFSIRTMMIVITLIGVVLGVYCERAERQRRACEQLSEWGVSWRFMTSSDRWKPWAQRFGKFRGGHYVYWIEEVRINGSKQRHVAGTMRLLGDLPGLTDFEASLCVLTVEDARNIARATSLRNVNLDHSNLDDDMLLALAPLTNVEELDLDETNIGTRGMAALARMRKLVSFSAYSTAIDDDGMRHLANLPSLRAVEVFDTRVTGRGINHLAQCKKIKWLGVSNLGNLSAAVDTIAGFPELVYFYANDTDLTDREITRLAANQNLTQVWLGNTAIGRAGLKAMAKLPKLTDLEIRQCDVGNDDLMLLAESKTLERIRCEDTYVDDMGALRLMRACPSLHIVDQDQSNDPSERRTVDRLDGNSAQTGINVIGKQFDLDEWRRLGEQAGLTEIFAHTSNLDDRALEQLTKLNTLASLHVQRCNITDHGLESIGQLSSLEYLDLERTHVTDAGLAHLTDLQHLKHLDLQGCQGVTDASVDVLLRLSRLERLVLYGTSISDAGAARLLALSNLKRVYLDPWRIGPLALQALRGKADNSELVLGFDEDYTLMGGSPPFRPRQGRLAIPEGVPWTDDILDGVLEMNSTNILAIHPGARRLTDLDFALLYPLTQLDQLYLKDHELTAASIPFFISRPYLRRLFLDGNNLGDESAELLAMHPEIEALGLSRTRLTDAGLRKLADMPSLNELWLADCRVTASGIESLGPVLDRIERLNVDDTEITPDEMRGLLRKMPRLKWFRYAGEEYNGEGNDNVALPWLKGTVDGANITSISLWGNLSDDDALAPLEQATYLKHVTLNRVSATSKTWARLRKARFLKQLDVPNSTLADIDLVDASQHWPDLRSIDFTNCKGVTDRGIQELAGCRDIWSVSLGGTSIDDEALAIVASWPNLQHLTVENTMVTDAGLRHLHQAKRLTSFGVRGSQVTPGGIQEFKHHRPWCRVSDACD